MPSLNRQRAAVRVYSHLGDRGPAQVAARDRRRASNGIGGDRLRARDFVFGNAEPLREPIDHRARDRRLGDVEVHLERLGVGEGRDDPGVAAHRQRP